MIKWNKSDIETMEKAIEKWGVEKQLIKLIEEAGEVIQEVAKTLHTADFVDEMIFFSPFSKEINLTEELADLYITLEQVCMIEFYDNGKVKKIGENINKVKVEKIQKLQNKLNEEVENVNN